MSKTWPQIARQAAGQEVNDAIGELKWQNNERRPKYTFYQGMEALDELWADVYCRSDNIRDFMEILLKKYYHQGFHGEVKRLRAALERFYEMGGRDFVHTDMEELLRDIEQPKSRKQQAKLRGDPKVRIESGRLVESTVLKLEIISKSWTTMDCVGNGA
ncbi:hypothetical protein P154DRAFT_536574 [Amniculicola lignicola CBS 123094]|uniref:Uncharacterized protein n=1 Tax=Amniculicola lignicola CBS 123094 TaxID=1392246 RepID=A0A6A5WBI9_9PLEO|nr:hypothetical protein P154DRAFT_536574 [Amniculicola lignicola CBS 123094]